LQVTEIAPGIDRWAVPRARYMTLETVAPSSDDRFVKLPAAAA
jgi:putative transposase